MQRREILSLTGFTLGMLAGKPSESFAQDRTSNNDLVDLNNCKLLLGSVITHINKRLAPVITLGKNIQEKKQRLSEIQLAAMDCQQFCTLACDVMSRNGPMSKYALRACADACRDFATLCSGIDPGAVIDECAKACAHCERICARRLTS
jgi:hypothetical protein